MIARADGSVLYNFAVAVDDLDAGITHVVRGEDHLSNTPKQLLVFTALGAEPPQYAHLPLLHGPDGRKLSKRHGAASVQELRDAGYLPEAVTNYIALLGAGFAADEEHFARDELAARFRLERVSKNPAVFDVKKLRHMNGQWLRELSTDELTDAARGVHRPYRAASGGRDQPGEDPDPRGLLAAGQLPVRRAGRRPAGVRAGARQAGGARASRRRAGGARPDRPVHRRVAGGGAAMRWSSASAARRGRCFSPSGWRLPGRRCPRGSSRAWPCWAARSRWRGSMTPSRGLGKPVQTSPV